jgi:transcriptional regulator with XRE-family HTH domain
MKSPSAANSKEYGRLGDRIRTARHRADLSQTELAKALGVSASAVAQWEHPRGTRPSLDNLIRVAEAAAVSFEWLATGVAANRPRARQAGMMETPAVSLDVYARTLQEETLLDRFRDVPARRQPLLITIAEEFSATKRVTSTKRR